MELKTAKEADQASREEQVQSQEQLTASRRQIASLEGDKDGLKQQLEEVREAASRAAHARREE